MGPPDKAERMERWRLSRVARLEKGSHPDVVSEDIATGLGEDGSPLASGRSTELASSSASSTPSPTPRISSFERTSALNDGGARTGSIRSTDRGAMDGGASTSSSFQDLVASDVNEPIDLADPAIPWAIDGFDPGDDAAAEDDTNWLGGVARRSVGHGGAPGGSGSSSSAVGAASARDARRCDKIRQHHGGARWSTSSPRGGGGSGGGGTASSLAFGRERERERSGGGGVGGRSGSSGSFKTLVSTPRPSTPNGAEPNGSIGAGRVRVGVRLRPLTRQELATRDPDEIPVVEASPETNRILLRRNQWDGESYQFDQAFPEHTSQKRLYEAVAAPVVESVLQGYNGTVMAYGQTGTGKTYTMGLLAPRAYDDMEGRLDMDAMEALESDGAGGVATAEETHAPHSAGDRGIMVRALERILEGAAAAGGDSTVTVSYLQVYRDHVYDLLAGKVKATQSLSVAEDYTTGEVHAVGARTVEIETLPQAMKVLREGEANRTVANHLLNASSSRSHALLSVTVRTKRRVVVPGNTSDDGDPPVTEVQAGASDATYPSAEVGGTLARSSGSSSGGGGAITGTRVLKGKLLLVDLAGSERAGKSGAEGQTFEEAKAINLHLHALGKCISALSAHTPTHVPYRESKLTRLLKDSFGGSAKTSLIVTIGPLRAHHSETAAALAFGQRALKVENTLRVKEDVDFKLSSRKLQAEVDRLTRELESAEDGRRAAERSAAAVAAASHAEETASLTDRLNDAVASRDAALATVDALRLEMALAAENSSALEAEQEAARDAERAELARRWEEEEAARREEEEAWRAEAESYRRERDELVEAAMAERERWTADRAAREAKQAAVEAAWEAERAALVAAAEAATSAAAEGESVALGRERAAAALAEVAAQAAWDHERAKLAAELDAQRASLAVAVKAEVARERAAAAEEMKELRAACAAAVKDLRAQCAAAEESRSAAEDGRRAAETALNAAAASHAKEMERAKDEARAAADDARREALAEAKAGIDALERAAEAARAETAAASAAASAAVETAVAKAVAACEAAAAEAHDALAERVEVAETKAAASQQAARDAADAREAWSIEVAVLRAKCQEEHDARVLEAAAHRREWAAEEAALRGAFDDREAALRRAFEDEAARMQREYEMRTDARVELAKEEAVAATIHQMLELSYEADDNGAPRTDESPGAPPPLPAFVSVTGIASESDGSQENSPKGGGSPKSSRSLVSRRKQKVKRTVDAEKEREIAEAAAKLYVNARAAVEAAGLDASEDGSGGGSGSASVGRSSSPIPPREGESSAGLFEGGLREALAARMFLASKRIEESRAAIREIVGRPDASWAKLGTRAGHSGAAQSSDGPPLSPGDSESVEGSEGGGHTRHASFVEAREKALKRDAVQKLFDQVGLKSIVSMMRYDDEDVRMHSVKVIANLAADAHNRGRIVEEGGLAALLDILGGGGKTNSEATCRIAAGALANLAMCEANQSLILSTGAVESLASFARSAREPSSHRMVAGAVANLCGNNQSEARLHAAGGLDLLVALSASDAPDVLTQVGRGFANYSRCEAGRRRMTSEGALPRVVALAGAGIDGDGDSNVTAAARRHAQVALCEMAMDPKNAGAVQEVPGVAEVLEYVAEQTSGGSSLRRAAVKALKVIGPAAKVGRAARQ